MLKVVADQAIPNVHRWFGQWAQVLTLPASAINRGQIQDADALIVRTRTHVDSQLLADTQVKFVGTATSGIDHMDIDWLESNNIHWQAAFGCNANAVAEYLVCCLAQLQMYGKLDDRPLNIGLIGAGHVGRAVASKMQALGHHMYFNDPVRAQNEPDFAHLPLDRFKDLDMVSLHVPLTYEGEHATHHLIGAEFLSALPEGCVLFNTSRGLVIDKQALQSHGQHLYWCLDVWPEEPIVDPQLAGFTTIATPHIAGYSRQAKHRGVAMLYNDFCHYFDFPAQPIVGEEPAIKMLAADHWQQAVLEVYDPSTDDEALRETLVMDEQDRARAFKQLRKDYVLRSEFNNFQAISQDKHTLDQLKALGFRLQPDSDNSH